MDGFFSDMKNFSHAYRVKVKIREEEKKSPRIREPREQSQRHLQDRKQLKFVFVDINAAKTKEGVMDSLLDALQYGSAFGTRDQCGKRRQRPAGS